MAVRGERMLDISLPILCFLLLWVSFSLVQALFMSLRQDGSSRPLLLQSEWQPESQLSVLSAWAHYSLRKGGDQPSGMPKPTVMEFHPKMGEIRLSKEGRGWLVGAGMGLSHSGPCCPALGIWNRLPPSPVLSHLALTSSPCPLPTGGWL